MKKETLIWTGLTIISLVLRLVGVIHWSWWLVLIPLWGPFVVVYGLVGLSSVFFIIMTILSHKWRVFKKRQ